MEESLHLWRSTPAIGSSRCNVVQDAAGGWKISFEVVLVPAPLVVEEEIWERIEDTINVADVAASDDIIRGVSIPVEEWPLAMGGLAAPLLGVDAVAQSFGTLCALDGITVVKAAPLLDAPFDDSTKAAPMKDAPFAAKITQSPSVGAFHDASVGTEENMFCLTEAELEALLKGTADRCNAQAQEQIKVVVSQFEYLKEQYAKLAEQNAKSLGVGCCTELAEVGEENSPAVNSRKTRRGKRGTTSVSPTKVAPSNAAPTKNSPRSIAPTKDATTKAATVDSPTKAAPTLDAPMKAAPIRKATPTKAARMIATPTRLAPTIEDPTKAVSTMKAAPMLDAPTKAALTKATPIWDQYNLAETPFMAAPTMDAPIEAKAAPLLDAPTKVAPTKATPIWDQYNLVETPFMAAPTTDAPIDVVPPRWGDLELSESDHFEEVKSPRLGGRRGMKFPS